MQEGGAGHGEAIEAEREIGTRGGTRTGPERWSGIFDQFAASLSSGMGFMSGGGFQVLIGGIIGFSGRQQPMR